MVSAQGLRAGKAFVETAVNNAGLISGLRESVNHVRRFSSSLRAVGMSMAGAGAAILGPLGAAVATFAGLEYSLARVRGLLGLGKEAKEFQALTAHARVMGETTMFSASQAGSAMVELAQRGMKAGDILKATKPLLNLAAAGSTDLATAATITKEIMSQFNVEASDTGKVADMLASSAAASGTDIIGLGEAFKYAGVGASGLKMSFEETAAAIEMLSNAGIKGSRAGTAIDGILLSLADKSRAPLLKKLGVRLADEKGDFRGMAAVLNDLHKAMEGLGNVERKGILGDLFTNRQVAGMDLLVEKPQELEQRTGRIQNERGKSEEMANVLMDTTWGAWKLIESAIEGVAITVGNELMPTIREWAAVIVDGVGVFSAIVKENKAWIPVVAKTGAALLIVGGALTAVGIGGLAIGAVFAGIGTAASLVVTPFLAIGAAIGALFTPVGLVVAGITAGVVAFATMTDAGRAMTSDLGRYFSNLGSSFVSTIGSMGETFGQAWGGIVNAVKAGDLGLAGEIAWKGLGIIWQKGVNWLSGLWRGFSGYFVDVFAEAGGMLVKGINVVWAGLELMWFDSFNAVGKAWGTMLDGMEKAYLWSIYQMKLKWLDWQRTVGAISKETHRNEIEYAFSGDVETGRKGYNTQVMEIVRRREGINKKNDKDRKDIVVRKDGVDKGIDDDLERGRKERAAANARAEKTASDALIEAEKELAEAIEEASKAAEAAAAMDRYRATGPWLGEFASRAPTLQGLDAAGARATGMGVNGGSAGTFDTNVLQYFGGGNARDTAEEKTQKKMDEQLAALKRIIEAIKDNSSFGKWI